MDTLDGDRPPRLRPWMLVSAAWVAPAILASFELYVQGRLENRPLPWRAVMFSGADWLICAGLTPAVFQIGRRLPMERASFRWRIWIHFLAALMFCAAWAGAGSILRRVLFGSSAGAFTPASTVGWFLTTLPFGVAVYFAVLGLEHAVRYFGEARARETQAARLGAQLSEARLSALRMQLHPHFLFNCLNALSVLLRDHETRTALTIVDELGEMLREVLHSGAANEITLRQEIAFVQRYLTIEQLRFSDRLRPILEIDDDLLDAAVPSFILQPLVENAIRHGIAKRVGAGDLRIQASRVNGDLVLSVRDDGPGLNDHSGPGALKPGGVGLANIRERLATLYGNRGRVELTAPDSGGALVVVRFPFRELAPPAEALTNG
jgi:hypothetical protein